MFALLKARGWAVELSAGESGMSFSAASLFSVNIVLTDEGGLQEQCDHGKIPDAGMHPAPASLCARLQASSTDLPGLHL